MACRHDWHQTGAQVVVTIYAKNSNPQHSYVETNRTVVSAHALAGSDTATQEMTYYMNYDPCLCACFYPVAFSWGSSEE